MKNIYKKNLKETICIGREEMNEIIYKKFRGGIELYEDYINDGNWNILLLGESEKYEDLEEEDIYDKIGAALGVTIETMFYNCHDRKYYIFLESRTRKRKTTHE